MLRQRGGKEAGGGGVLAGMPYPAMTSRAVPGHSVNLSQIEFGKFGSGSAKNTRMGSNRLPSDL